MFHEAKKLSKFHVSSSVCYFVCVLNDNTIAVSNPNKNQTLNKVIFDKTDLRTLLKTIRFTQVFGIKTRFSDRKEVLAEHVYYNIFVICNGPAGLIHKRYAHRIYLS